MKMKFTAITVIALLFACLCRGQLTGDDVKTARDANSFPSQVLVEVSRQVTTIRGPNYKQLAGLRETFPKMFEPSKFIVAGSGTIIDKRWILTAAHLFNTNEYKKTVPDGYPPLAGKEVLCLYKVTAVRVMIGQTDRESASGYTHLVEHVRIHKDYIPNNWGTGLGSDIALIQLRAPLRYQDRRNMLLPTFNPTPEMGMDCKIVGWGETNGGKLPRFLKWSETRIVDKTQSEYQMYAFSEDLLAVGEPQRHIAGKERYSRAGTRDGDSGSGLLCQPTRGGREYVFGVCHGGNKGDFSLSGTLGYPSLFTNVYHHLEWIRGEMTKPAPEGSHEDNFISSYPERYNPENPAKTGEWRL